MMKIELPDEKYEGCVLQAGNPPYWFGTLWVHRSRPPDVLLWQPVDLRMKFTEKEQAAEWLKDHWLELLVELEREWPEDFLK